MSTTYIQIDGIDNALATATENARERRDELVLDSAKIRAVVTVDDARLASDQLKDLKAFLTTIEEARKTVKGPVDTLAAKIQAIAKELTLEVQTQYDRLNRMVGTYQQEQQRLQREADEKARAAEQKILDDAAEKQRQIEASGVRVESRVEKNDAKAFEQIAAVRAQAPVAPKLEGVGLRTVPEFEILDIHAVYAARPELVKLEISKSALNNLLNSNPKIVIPGVKHWRTAKSTVS
jgi:uncharacterized protein YhaN